MQGSIAELQNFPGVKVLRAKIDLQAGWPRYQAGQFTFVTSDPKEDGHPYTLASAWDANAPQITLFTKVLGDHTSTLEHKLKPGMPVTVKGPYGCFTFTDEQPVQNWIGAGGGITPFIARMQQLAQGGAV